MKARVVLLAISLGTPLVAGSAQQKRDPMAGMDHMRGMKHDSAAMPIPMPKGMPMIPGLVGLVPSGGVGGRPACRNAPADAEGALDRTGRRDFIIH